MWGGATAGCRGGTCPPPRGRGRGPLLGAPSPAAQGGAAAVLGGAGVGVGRGKGAGDPRPPKPELESGCLLGATTAFNPPALGQRPSQDQTTPPVPWLTPSLPHLLSWPTGLLQAGAPGGAGARMLSPPPQRAPQHPHRLVLRGGGGWQPHPFPPSSTLGHHPRRADPPGQAISFHVLTWYMTWPWYICHLAWPGQVHSRRSINAAPVNEAGLVARGAKSRRSLRREFPAFCARLRSL